MTAPDPLRYPLPWEWEAYDAYMEHGRSAIAAGRALGWDRDDVIAGTRAVSDWLRASGWTERYREAIRWGFSVGEAMDAADRHAAYTMRAER